MVSKFRNGGQTCVCANRILVQSGIHDAFVAALAKRIDALQVGTGTDAGTTIGPMINAAAIDKIRAHVADAVGKGALRRSGGASRGHDRHETGQRRNLRPRCPIFRFDTEEQVLATANGTPYGLAAYFFTRDLSGAFRVGEALEFGLVGLNTGAVSHAESPFGGVKSSGLGREGAQQGIDEYLETKALHFEGL